VKFSFCNEFCGNMSLDSVFQLASRLGYDGVEVAPFTLAESVREIGRAERRRIADSAKQAGIEVVGLHWLLVSPRGLHLNHPEQPEVRERTVAYLIDLVRFCADLGGRIMVFGSPKQRNLVSGHSRRETWDLTVEAFQRCLPACAEAGVTLCIEPLGPAETSFICSHREAIDLVKAIDHPNFRMILDVKAMSSEAMPIPDIIHESAGCFAHFHANDANRRGPGFGDTDFVPILRALTEVEYPGYVSVEVFDFKPDGETIAAQSLRYLRECLAAVQSD